MIKKEETGAGGRKTERGSYEKTGRLLTPIKHATRNTSQQATIHSLHLLQHVRLRVRLKHIHHRDIARRRARIVQRRVHVHVRVCIAAPARVPSATDGLRVLLVLLLLLLLSWLAVLGLKLCDTSTLPSSPDLHSSNPPAPGETQK